MADRRVQASNLQACVEGIFAGHHLPPADAATVAATLVEADLRGVRSHGVILAPAYVQSLAEGRLNARPEVKVVRDEGAPAVLDGDRGLGQVPALVAMREAIARARQHGIGAVALRNSSHVGALAYWAMLALEADCIGVAVSNSGYNMAPWGGLERIIGNNPFAVAAPTGRPWPLVLDMATSVVANGKIGLARARGEKIPLGWVLDADLRPTDDPNASRMLLPAGGYKGYGLAVILDILAGVLSGGRFGHQLGMGGASQFFLALEIERYLPLPEFLARMGELIDQIHASPLAPGCDRIYLPGEMEYELKQARLREGIPIEEATLGKLDRLAEAVGAPRLMAEA